MQRRLVPILVITAILLLLAVGGYLVPAGSEAVPKRILFDTPGGKVVLTHAAHSRQFPCADCHHHGPDGAINSPLRCPTCHPSEFGDEFKTAHQAAFEDPFVCADCHHAELAGMAFDHDQHQEILGDDCLACHHDTDIDPGPSGCADCHGETGDAAMPSLRDAGHTRCADCHEEVEPQAMACRTCHEIADQAGQKVTAPAACSLCHADGVPLPARADAFHGQCMGCHESNQSGPYGKDGCDNCHFR